MIKTTYEIWQGSLEVRETYKLEELDKAEEESGKYIEYEVIEESGIETLKEGKEHLKKYAGDADNFIHANMEFTRFTVYELFKVEREIDENGNETNSEITSYGRV